MIVHQSLFSDETDNDPILENELIKYGIRKLYRKLLAAGVTSDDLWDLDDKMIKICKLKPLEIHQYEEAKKQKLDADDTDSHSATNSGSIPFSYLNH